MHAMMQLYVKLSRILKPTYVTVKYIYVTVNTLRASMWL